MLVLVNSHKAVWYPTNASVDALGENRTLCSVSPIPNYSKRNPLNWCHVGCWPDLKAFQSIEIHSTTQTVWLHLIFYWYSDWQINQAHAAVRHLLLSCSLSVFLRQGAGQGSQELVHRHMDLRGEVSGEHGGQDHKDVVRENLWIKK